MRAARRFLGLVLLSITSCMGGPTSDWPNGEVDQGDDDTPTDGAGADAGTASPGTIDGGLPDGGPCVSDGGARDAGDAGVPPAPDAATVRCVDPAKVP